jgi:hypothetical protein
VGAWWQSLNDQGRLQLAAALAAFVVTFLITRGIVHLIRSGHGPFRNISVGGLHVHHVVPGVILMTVGGFMLAAVRTTGGLATAAAIVFGVGAGLVLDEFALILHLDDVYWSEQGRLSVEVIAITTASVGIFLVGLVPTGNDVPIGGNVNIGGREVVAINIAVNLVFTIIAMSKGKFWLGLIGVVVPTVSIVGAIRLARPDSWWARSRYREGRRPDRMVRAQARENRRVARLRYLPFGGRTGRRSVH